MNCPTGSLRQGIGEGQSPFPVKCTVCKGCGLVIWDYVRTPRAPETDETSLVGLLDLCPACDGSGIEA